ncbi:MAG TPA: hypothetical protein VGV89_07270 [Thermoplasmata archaeon]|nr:hypothetical protein [Thermoplasmata archaeon]
MTTETGQKYTRADYDKAAAEWNTAREASTAARRAWDLAAQRMEAAEVALSEQEVQPGVPAYQHAELVKDPAACRIGYCAIHPDKQYADDEPF